MAKNDPPPDAERLAVFLVNLAIDSTKRQEFEASPDDAMRKADLSADTAQAIKDAQAAKLVEQLINLQSTGVDMSKALKKKKKGAKKAKAGKKKLGKKK